MVNIYQVSRVILHFAILQRLPYLRGKYFGHALLYCRSKTARRIFVNADELRPFLCLLSDVLLYVRCQIACGELLVKY